MDLVEAIETWCRPYLTVEEFAEMIGLAKKTIYEMLKRTNHPPYHRVAGKIRFNPMRLADWLRANER